MKRDLVKLVAHTNEAILSYEFYTRQIWRGLQLIHYRMMLFPDVVNSFANRWLLALRVGWSVENTHELLTQLLQAASDLQQRLNLRGHSNIACRYLQTI